MPRQYEEIETRTNDLLTNYLKTTGRSSDSLLFCQYIGEAFKHEVKVSKKGVVTVYAPKDELERVDQIMIDRLDKNLLFNKKQVEEAIEHLRKIDNFLFSLSKKNYQKLSNKQLLALFNQYYQTFYNHAAILHIVFRLDELLKSHIQELTDFASKKIGDIQKAQNFVGILSLPNHKSYVSQEEEKFLKILVKTNNVKKIPKNSLKNHSEKYCWITIQQDENPRDIEYYETLAKEKLNQKEQLKNRLAKLINYIPNLQNQQKEILSELKLPKELKKITIDLQNIGHIRDIRKMTYSKARYYSRFLLDECSKRINLNRKNIGYLTPEEIESYLLGKQKPNMKQIDVRKQYYVQEFINNTINIFTGTEAMKKEKILKTAIYSEIKDKKLIKGMGAYPGKVQGRVRKVKNMKDTVNFKPGEILVALMTTPEVVPVMKKAAAIVTDEGGLTCHAAIVSRELQTPCVVGTKYATKIFKNSDLIEVDAYRGIARKLK